MSRVPAALADGLGVEAAAADAGDPEALLGAIDQVFDVFQNQRATKKRRDRRVPFLDGDGFIGQYGAKAFFGQKGTIDGGIGTPSSAANRA